MIGLSGRGSNGDHSKLRIFQGPIFGNANRSKEKVQPIGLLQNLVCRRYDGELKSVAFVLDQNGSLNEKRVSLGWPC